jgi:hypothetical protein
VLDDGVGQNQENVVLTRMIKKSGQDEKARNLTDQNVNQAKGNPDRYGSSAHVPPEERLGSSLVDGNQELEDPQVPTRKSNDQAP